MVGCGRIEGDSDAESSAEGFGEIKVGLDRDGFRLTTKDTKYGTKFSKGNDHQSVRKPPSYTELDTEDH